MTAIALFATTVAIDRAALLFGSLTLVANVLVVVAVVLVVGGRVAPALRAVRQRGHLLARRWGLPAAAVVAVTATAGSLWFSEVAGLRPCRLCWFQRTEMYPLAIILAVAALRRDRSIAWYAVPLAALGAAVSTYHYVLEWNPNLDSGSCDPLNPCTVVYFRTFGFMSLPYMALSGFLAIMVLAIAAARPPTPRGAL
ncbi:MAG: disulfide bond formation protein [Acidimicrobiales bacterium]|nr:disulfide bond formation protein [Acidimicrobiales bacterium]